MLCLLIDDEESEESRRDFPHNLIYFIECEIVPEDGVLVGASVVSRYEF